MKKIVIKIILIILLLGLIVFEGIYYFVLSDKNIENNNINNPTNPEVVDNSKYVADLFTGYKSNGLDYKMVKIEDNIYHMQIEGLKDKDVEKKVNDRIKEELSNIKEKYKDKKFTVTSFVFGSFENFLSVSFDVTFYNERDSRTYEEFVKSFQENIDTGRYLGEFSEVSLNFDLRNGNLLTVDDVFLNIDQLKEIFVRDSYEYLSKNIGLGDFFLLYDDYKPDYSSIEDSILSITNQLNAKNFDFVIEEDFVYVKVKDVYVLQAKSYDSYFDEKEFEEMKKKYTCDEHRMEIDDADSVWICKDVVYNTFMLEIPSYELADTLLVYEKFKTDESIFTKEQKINKTKFTTFPEYDSYNHSYLKEEDNILYNYELSLYNCTYCDAHDDRLREKFAKDIESKVLKESSALQTDNFNIYNIFGNTSSIAEEEYTYVYFDVYHYDLSKEKYLDNKRQIYLDKYSLTKFDQEELKTFYVRDYDYLKEYLTKKSYYFYIIDKDGNEVNSRDIIKDSDYLKSFIPDEWIELGKYKTKDELYNSLFIMADERDLFNDRLILIDSGYDLKLKYQGKVVTICQMYNYSIYMDIVDKLYK